MKCRLVLNHSTFVDGLLPLLKRLQQAPSLQSIIPGRISSAKKSRQPKLEIRLTEHMTTNKSNSVRLLARRGTQLQEIYVVYHHHLINDNDNDDKNKVLTYIKNYLNDDNVIIREKNDNNTNNNNDDENSIKHEVFSDKYLKLLE